MPVHYLVYRLLLVVLAPLILAHISWLSIRNKEPRYFRQRLAIGIAQLPANALWFHCASVGEVNTALPLLKNLHEKDSSLRMIITTNTITGGKIVAQQKLDYLHHYYLPFDWGHTVKRFISRTHPGAVFIVETEIWPTLFSVCHRRMIPLYIINARLSKKTTAASKRVKALLGYSLSKVRGIYARSQDNAAAYIELGAAEDIVTVAGNLKFTTAMQAQAPAVDDGLSIDRDYVLLASTHNDEEKNIYELWKQLKRPELLVIAPRHPERAEAIIKQLGCDHIALRNKGHSGLKSTIDDDTEVFILNTVGELKSLFHRSKLVIMGGSFVAIGGHNILEPAAYHKAIITGPNMDNFIDELELMKKNNAIIQLGSYRELPQAISRLLHDADDRAMLEANTSRLNHDVEKILRDYTDLILSVAD